MPDLPIDAGVVPLAALIVGIAVFGVLLLHRGPRWWTRRVPLAIAVGLGLTVLVGVTSQWWRPAGQALSTAALAWTAVVLVATGLALLRGRRSRTTGPALVLVVALAGCGVIQVTGTTGRPSTAADLLSSSVDQVPAAEALTDSAQPAVAVGPLIDGWQPPPDLPATGQVTVVPIPGTVSGFAAGDAWVYLPPAYATTSRTELPVLVLLAGNPGEPRDWFDGGALATTMDDYAADHHGLAPVVIVPDWLGTSGANPLCVDSAASGDDYSYLTVDVHDWIVDTLQVDVDPRGWAVGGFSAGGTCALQLATRDPVQYPTVLAFSTQDHPVLETDEDTVDALFDGDQGAYDAYDPMVALADSTFPDSAGFFAAGADDDVYRPQTEAVYRAAVTAGMDAQYTILPGGHDFSVWSAALELALPWLGSRRGVSP